MLKPSKKAAVTQKPTMVSERSVDNGNLTKNYRRTGLQNNNNASTQARVNRQCTLPIVAEDHFSALRHFHRTIDMLRDQGKYTGFQESTCLPYKSIPFNIAHVNYLEEQFEVVLGSLLTEIENIPIEAKFTTHATRIRNFRDKVSVKFNGSLVDMVVLGDSQICRVFTLIYNVVQKRTQYQIHACFRCRKYFFHRCQLDKTLGYLWTPSRDDCDNNKRLVYKDKFSLLWLPIKAIFKDYSPDFVIWDRLYKSDSTLFCSFKFDPLPSDFHKAVEHLCHSKGPEGHIIPYNLGDIYQMDGSLYQEWHLIPNQVLLWYQYVEETDSREQAGISTWWSNIKAHYLWINNKEDTEKTFENYPEQMPKGHFMYRKDYWCFMSKQYEQMPKTKAMHLFKKDMKFPSAYLSLKVDFTMDDLLELINKKKLEVGNSKVLPVFRREAPYKSDFGGRAELAIDSKSKRDQSRRDEISPPNSFLKGAENTFTKAPVSKLTFGTLNMMNNFGQIATSEITRNVEKVAVRLSNGQKRTTLKEETKELKTNPVLSAHFTSPYFPTMKAPVISDMEGPSIFEDCPQESKEKLNREQILKDQEQLLKQSTIQKNSLLDLKKKPFEEFARKDYSTPDEGAYDMAIKASLVSFEQEKQYRKSFSTLKEPEEITRHLSPVADHYERIKGKKLLTEVKDGLRKPPPAFEPAKLYSPNTKALYKAILYPEEEDEAAQFMSYQADQEKVKGIDWELVQKKYKISNQVLVDSFSKVKKTRLYFLIGILDRCAEVMKFRKENKNPYKTIITDRLPFLSNFWNCLGYIFPELKPDAMDDGNINFFPLPFHAEVLKELYNSLMHQIKSSNTELKVLSRELSKPTVSQTFKTFSPEDIRQQMEKIHKLLVPLNSLKIRLEKTMARLDHFAQKGKKKVHPCVTHIIDGESADSDFLPEMPDQTLNDSE